MGDSLSHLDDLLSFIHFIGPNFKDSVQARKMLLLPLHSSHS